MQAPLVLLLWLLPSSATVHWPQRGMTFTAGKYCPYVGFDSALSDLSLTELASTGANWVSVVDTTFQRFPNSTTFLSRHPLTATTKQLSHVTTYAHRLGLRVMLKPHIDLACALGPGQLLPAANPSMNCGLSGSSVCGTWRGCIGQRNGAVAAFNHSQWAAWFESYTTLMLEYATLAERLGIEQLSIGCELQVDRYVSLLYAYITLSRGHRLRLHTGEGLSRRFGRCIAAV